MRYYVPRIEAPDARNPQGRVIDKLGGLPWGVSPDQWPVCTDCGRHQTHLATLLHDADRINLGEPSRVLMLFQCDWDPGMCDTWSADSGGSVALVVDADVLLHRLSAPPVDGLPVGTEGWISQWTVADDGVDAEMYPAFFIDGERNLLDATVVDGIPQGTKVGGTPYWIQGADDAPGTGWRFVLQLDGQLRFATDPGRAVKARRQNGSWVADGPNFGDMGMAYVFVSADDPTRTILFWQCG